MAKLPPKIAGVKTPLFVLGVVVLAVGAWYLRSRAAAAAQTSSAGPAASTLDTGLGGGAGAVSTPTDNGLGSTTVGTDSLSTGVLAAYQSGFQSLLDANLQMAANAGSYYSTSTTTNSTYNYTGGQIGVTTPGGWIGGPSEVAPGVRSPAPTLPPVSSLHLPAGQPGNYGPVITDVHGGGGPTARVV